MRKKLQVACVLLLLAATQAHAAPPSFAPPEKVPIVAGYAVYAPPADCVSVKYKGLSGEDPFPLELVGGSKTAFFFPTRGLPAGKVYRFYGVAASNTGEQVDKEFTVVVPGAPVDPKDPPVDPKDPPTPPTGKLYFLVVRPDGPAQPAFTTIMSSPAWDGLRNAGHRVGDATLTEVRNLNLGIPTGTTLPVVVTLRVSADGKSSTVARAAIPLPTTADGISKLPEGVK